MDVGKLLLHLPGFRRRAVHLQCFGSKRPRQPSQRKVASSFSIHLLQVAAGTVMGTPPVTTGAAFTDLICAIFFRFRAGNCSDQRGLADKCHAAACQLRRDLSDTEYSDAYELALWYPRWSTPLAAYKPRTSWDVVAIPSRQHSPARIALVTGGDQRIGRGIVVELACAGYGVSFMHGTRKMRRSSSAARSSKTGRARA